MKRLLYNPLVAHFLRRHYVRQALHHDDPDYRPLGQRLQEWYLQHKFIRRRGPHENRPVRTLIISAIVATLLLGNLVSAPHIARTASQTPGTAISACLALSPVKPPLTDASDLCHQLFGTTSSLANTSVPPDPTSSFTAIDMGSLAGPNGNSTPAEGGIGSPINSSGEVAGTSTAGGAFLNPNVNAFVWNLATGMHSLGTLGGSTSFGLAINDFGEVVGTGISTGC